MGDTTATGGSQPDSLVAPTDEQIDAVVRATRVLVALNARSGAAIEGRVTPSQLRVLLLVARCGRINVGSVAHDLGVHSSTATRTCDRMVGMGLLHRHDDPGDRRNLVLELASAGHELVNEIDMRRRDAVAAMLRRLRPESRQSFTSALATFAATGSDVKEGT